MISFKEYCEKYMRILGFPDDEVEQAARNFWYQSPTGELCHVFDAIACVQEYEAIHGAV